MRMQSAETPAGYSFLLTWIITPVIEYMKRPKTIFQLEMLSYSKCRRRHRDDYQPIEIRSGWTLTCLSLEEAETALPDLVKRFNEKYYFPLYCCHIREFPLGVIRNNSSDNYSDRLYDQNGVKLDERLFPTYQYMDGWSESTYLGRKPEEIRFNPGDVVDYGGDLCVVDSFMRPYKEGAKPFGDSSDDCYTVWYVDKNADNIEFDDDGYVLLGHDHPEAISLLPPRFPISERDRRRIENIRRFLSEKDRDLASSI